MSQILKPIFALLAVSATFGAVQFASGHDLTGRRQSAATAPETVINRIAKADRAAAKVAPGQSETITVRAEGLADSSVVVRIPIVKEQARNRPVAPMKPGKSKTAVACEPPVSVLTEVAKLLEPGRCVT
ncbi:hypothetical protein ACFIOY_09505 [Bradyrhizobium sp. TZ2]